jgi:hypothetical protein
MGSSLRGYGCRARDASGARLDRSPVTAEGRITAARFARQTLLAKPSLTLRTKAALGANRFGRKALTAIAVLTSGARLILRAAQGRHRLAILAHPATQAHEGIADLVFGLTTACPLTGLQRDGDASRAGAYAEPAGARWVFAWAQVTKGKRRLAEPDTRAVGIAPRSAGTAHRGYHVLGGIGDHSANLACFDSRAEVHELALPSAAHPQVTATPGAVLRAGAGAAGGKRSDTTAQARPRISEDVCRTESRSGAIFITCTRAPFRNLSYEHARTRSAETVERFFGFEKRTALRQHVETTLGLCGLETCCAATHRVDAALHVRAEERVEDDFAAFLRAQQKPNVVSVATKITREQVSARRVDEPRAKSDERDATAPGASGRASLNGAYRATGPTRVRAARIAVSISGGVATARRRDCGCYQQSGPLHPPLQGIHTTSYHEHAALGVDRVYGARHLVGNFVRALVS